MPEFLQLIPVQDAIDTLLKHLPANPKLGTETVPTSEALGRVLAQSIEAPHPLPEFARSTVDGYAVKARDTYGASSSLPSYLKLGGEIRMGENTALSLQTSQAILIHTGAMLPQGADAVVMLEDTQQLGRDEVEILRPVAVGENVIQLGEDVSKGDVVIESGKQIRAQEIGGMLALGYTNILVYRRPRVGIISSGDEIVQPELETKPGQVRDINSYTLMAIVDQSGGEAILHGIIPDNLETLQSCIRESHAKDDVVVVTAGSSVSARDLTARAMSELGDPGILVHGIQIKPGKPTILGVADQIPFIGMPGNPVSALVVGSLILPVVIHHLLGLHDPLVKPYVEARLSANIASQAGIEDYQPVQLWEDDDGLHAEPIYGRSNLIFTLVRANGLVRIPPEATGYQAGTIVPVMLI